MLRRDFLQALAAAGLVGFSGSGRAAEKIASVAYDPEPFGNVQLMHMTDCHAQLLPIYYREPSVNLGVGGQSNKLPHLVGKELLVSSGVAIKSPMGYALSHLDFVEAAKTYGQMGGFAHLATLVKQLRASRPNALLLDGGDTWQGSATALWTKGQDMVDACKLLGVDMMTGHWEFTLGAERVRQVIDHDFKDQIRFLAHNVQTTDFGDPVFEGSTLRTINGVAVAIIGQAFPYTPIANPRRFVPDWSFGIREQELQTQVNTLRGKGAQVVVLLSHNGMDVDLKLASRVSGIDAILGGHTHDAVLNPITVSNPSGKTIVTNAGSHGKFLGLLEFDVRNGKIADFRYRLLPVFSRLLAPDPAMQALIEQIRAPHAYLLNQNLAVNESLLYRRGNFNGSFDQLLLEGLMAEKNAEIAFSPGFRWGTSILPDEGISFERLMDQTAITYPATTLSEMSGAAIKDVLEDVADNLFNPDPYYQQGGDMVRVGGLQYAIAPNAAMGKRITDLRLHGKPLDASKNYKVAGWASVGDAQAGEPIWDLMVRYLRQHERVSAPVLNLPKVTGMDGNLGIATES